MHSAFITANGTEGESVVVDKQLPVYQGPSLWIVDPDNGRHN